MKTEEIYTSFVKDITEITVTSVPFMATLTIMDKTKEKPINISPLRPKDSKKAKDIIDDLLLKRNEDKSSSE